MRILSIAVLAAALATGPAHAAEVSVMSGGAVKSAFTAAAGAWEKRSGHTVNAVFAPAGDLRKKVAAGDVTDIIIVPAENFAQLEGAIDPSSRRDLGVVAMGAAVRKGAPVPDISTPEALKKTLTEAKSLTYMDPQRGNAASTRRTVLPEARHARCGARQGDLARAASSPRRWRGRGGDRLHQMTEMLPVAGVTIVGPLPAELQKNTIYTGAVMKKAKNPLEAQALLEYLVSAEGRKAFLDRGFTAP